MQKWRGARVSRFLLPLLVIGLVLGGCATQPSQPAQQPAAPAAQQPAAQQPAAQQPAAQQPAAQQPAAQPAAPAEPIKLGVFFSETGGASSLGKGEMQTVELLTEQLNAKGGINGRPLELVKIDDKSVPTEAVLAVNKLIDAGVVGIVGGTTSGNTLAVIDTIQKEGIPYISAAASIQIVDPVKKWVFKTPQSDTQAVAKILSYMKEQGMTRVGWISIASAYGDSGRVEIQKLAPQYGIEIVADERYNPQETDMTTQLANIKAKNPDAVINWATPPEASTVTRNFADLGFNAKLFQSHGVANAAFLEQSGDAANGVILPAGYLIVADALPDSNPRKPILMGYINDFKAKFGEAPNTFGGHAWDGFMLMTEAIKAVGTDRAQILDYLENKVKAFPGITGTFTFSPEDHLGLHDEDAFALVEVKGGNWTLLQH